MDNDSFHLPAQAWSYRVPSPPRLNVPPPALDRRGMPQISLGQGGSVDFKSTGFANADFLKTVNLDELVTRNAMLDWKYEQRRQAQQILPFLWLGPVAAARDRGFLQENGITMVIAVRNTLSAQARLLGSKPAKALGIHSETIDVAGNPELIAAFPRAIEMINLHLSNAYQVDQSRSAMNKGNGISGAHGKVLVFCETGNERSAAVVVAYIMAMYSVQCVKAIQLAQAQRFAVSIDDSMKHLLQTYESMLKAKRDVFSAGNGAWPSNAAPVQQNDVNSEPRRNSKRTLEDVYDEMEVDGNEEDRTRFGERTASAPFKY